MKRIVLIVILSLFAIIPSYAQYNTADQKLKFVYVTFDEKTDSQTLINRLNEIYNYAMDYPENYAAIFYMPNGESPIIVKINMPGDNYKDFDRLVSAIQRQPANLVLASYDVERIHKLFDENDLIDENGKGIYRSVDWLYYINPSFWSMKNNEFVIARLYFTMEMDKLMAQDNYLTLNIYCTDGNKMLHIDKKTPFGSKDLCRSFKLAVLPY